MLVQSVRTALGVSIALSVFGAGRDVAAIGPNPPAFWTLTGALPAERVVPTDGAILLVAESWKDAVPGGGRGVEPAPVRVSVLVNGTLAPGTVEQWYPAPTFQVAWRPDSPLPANSLVHVDASIESTVPRPATVGGVTSLSADFTTGPGPAPPMRIAGPLQATLETYDHTVWGLNGEPVVTSRDLRARLTIPAVEGGYTPGNYGAWLSVTDSGVGLVNLRGLETIPPNTPTTVLGEIPAEELPYAPCFDLSVFDPAGHSVEAERLCLPRMDVRAVINQLDRGRTAGGCSLAAEADGGGLARLALFLALLLIARRSRTRPCPSVRRP